MVYVYHRIKCNRAGISFCGIFIFLIHNFDRIFNVFILNNSWFGMLNFSQVQRKKKAVKRFSFFKRNFDVTTGIFYI